MRIIIQRVTNSSVVVSGNTVGSIDKGLMCLVGFGHNDNETVLDPMLEKIINMRIFENDEGRFDKSLIDIGGGLLLVPQFTLYADLKKGRRPDFTGAMNPKDASVLFDRFVDRAQKSEVTKVSKGKFGADMKVSLLNDGPVTILVDSETLLKQ